jgi:hypothetical protein
MCKAQPLRSQAEPPLPHGCVLDACAGSMRSVIEPSLHPYQLRRWQNAGWAGYGKVDTLGNRAASRLENIDWGGCWSHGRPACGVPTEPFRDGKGDLRVPGCPLFQTEREIPKNGVCRGQKSPRVSCEGDVIAAAATKKASRRLPRVHREEGSIHTARRAGRRIGAPPAVERLAGRKSSAEPWRHFCSSCRFVRRLLLRPEVDGSSESERKSNSFRSGGDMRPRRGDLIAFSDASPRRRK